VNEIGALKIRKIIEKVGRGNWKRAFKDLPLLRAFNLGGTETTQASRRALHGGGANKTGAHL
jgi:hypothetical protein